MAWEQCLGTSRADLLRIEELYSSLFDSAKGNPFITRKVLKDSDTNFAPKLAKCGIFS